MMIKQNSKTLQRTYNPVISVMAYHATRVGTVYHSRKLVELRTGGWITQNTARAINFFFEEQGINAVARFTKSKRVDNVPTIFVTVNGVEHRLVDFMSFQA